MFEEIEKIFEDYRFLNSKDLIQLASIIKLKRILKGEHLIREGELNYNGVIVVKGLLAHYVIDNNGFEKMLLFVPEKRFSGSLQTTINKKSADENVVALEDCLLVTCDIRLLESLAADNIRILKLLNQCHKEIILEAATRIKFLITNSPEERYMLFTKTYPNLEQRLKQKELASFLGVTISSLSRMRARIQKKAKSGINLTF